MITCRFFLNNRIKTFTEKTIKDCLKSFLNNYHEAIKELKFVIVLNALGNGSRQVIKSDLFKKIYLNKNDTN